MALEQPHGVFGKVSTVFATKLKSFTFLPVLKKLPTENKVKSVWEKRPSKISEALIDHAEEKTKDEGSYKAEVVHVSDLGLQETTKHTETQQQNSTTKSAIAPLPTPAVAHAEISCTRPKLSPGILDATDNKHLKTPQLGCHNTGAEVSSGLFLYSESQREEEVLSPVSSVDIFTSPFSSKESIHSEAWDQETGWSALQMYSKSLSGSVSPCSSVRSGAFTPSVMRIKCHTLAPGSSLMQMPLTSCQTLGCNERITSPCPLSSRARHRPPPTQLSLLTAILRKGRLPVLSSALQRPYSPCWPISPVNMSSCMACSAASSVVPLVGLQAKSCMSKGTTCTQPSCKVRPKPPGLITKTLPASPKDHNKESLSSTAVVTTDAIDSNTYAASSKIISTPDGRCSLTLSSYSPSEPPPAHPYKQTHKGIHVSTDPSLLLGSYSSRPMSFSPEFNLDSKICGNGHKSNDTATIVRNTKTSSSYLKCIQMTHESTPDHKPIQQSQEVLDSAVPEYTEVKPDSLLQNNSKLSNELEKNNSVSPVFQHYPSPKVASLTHLSNIPSISPVLPSPRPGSCTSTSDRYTLSSSPAIPYHHLSPSPSYSLCSSPTPSLRDSTPDCINGASKKPYKIKSTYKALAAIPTNTLLLEQQAIDDEVYKNDPSPDPSDSFTWEDPHSQMYSPAQLRQQSTELYQVIDEILKDTNQTKPSSPANKLTVKSVASETTMKLTPSSSSSSSSPRPLGRETKYANFHHQPPVTAEKTLTKPGVIRPAMVLSRLDDGKEKSCFLNTSQRQQDSFSTDHQHKLARSMLSTKEEPHGRRDLEWERDSPEVPEKCMSSSALGMNQTREHTTLSPNDSSL